MNVVIGIRRQDIIVLLSFLHISCGYTNLR